MPYDTDMVMRGQQPYNVVRRLREPDYATNIAENLETSQQTVSEIIGVLKEEWGILKVSERKRATYYVIDYDSLFDCWKKLLKVETDKTDHEIGQYAKEEFTGEFDLEETWEQEMLHLMGRWTYHYTSSIDKSSIKKMLLDDFFLAVHSLPQKVREQYPVLSMVQLISGDLYDFDQDPKAILQAALNDITE